MPKCGEIDLNETYQRFLALESSGIRLGLERIHAFMEWLGRPQLRAPRTLVITGTNGKGSVAAHVSAAATAAGLRVGLFTSPHLVQVTERFRLNDEDMDWTTFDALGTRLLKDMDASNVPLSFFEAITSLALVYFAEEAVDLQILEVGLGGARDATAVTRPTHAVLTGLARDHMEVLGPTLRHIAEEKLGICRKAGDGVYALPPRLHHLCPKGALVGRDLRYRRTAQGMSVALDGVGTMHLPEPTLPGVHQVRNVAIAAGIARKLGISESAVAVGMQRVRWRARMERLSKNPPVWVDGAHNLAAVASLIRSLPEVGLHSGFSLVFGASPRKDIRAMADRLTPYAGTVLCTGLPRLLPAAELAAHFHSHHDVRVVPDPHAALAAARQLGKPVLVVGSLYLAGALLAEHS